MKTENLGAGEVIFRYLSERRADGGEMDLIPDGTVPGPERLGPLRGPFPMTDLDVTATLVLPGVLLLPKTADRPGRRVGYRD